MAQTGYTPILLYSSSTTTNAPAAGNLINSTFGSELAINIADGKLFYKDPSNNVQVIAWKTTPTTAGGTGLTSYTAGDLTYYASGTTLTKLAIGASTTILTSSGTAPQWSAASGITVGTATNLAGGVAGSVPYQTAASTKAMLAIGVSGRWLGSSGTAPQWNAPAALTKTDDTNVTLTLGGSASTALLNAASLTLGWTGTLAVSRGGTGTGTAFTAGSIIFAGASGVYSQDNPNLFWDDANNRFGVGTAAPNRNVEFAFSGGTTLGVSNSAQGAGILYGRIALYSTGFSNAYIDYGGEIRSYSGGGVDYSDLRFYTAAGATSTEKARIFSSGGVSINNTTDPGAGNLSVSGNVTLNPGTSDSTTYTQAILKGGTASGNGIGYMKRQTTPSVANSATDILGVGSFGALVIVTGVGSGAIFSDLLMVSYNGAAVVSSNTQQGSPASRTYTTASGYLRLAMGTATAMAITAQSLETGGTGA